MSITHAYHRIEYYEYRPLSTLLVLRVKVQFDVIMSGFGTAIGELPPYFVARTSSFISGALLSTASHSLITVHLLSSIRVFVCRIAIGKSRTTVDVNIYTISIKALKFTKFTLSARDCFDYDYSYSIVDRIDALFTVCQ